jgi:hypothetical protein
MSCVPLVHIKQLLARETIAALCAFSDSLSLFLGDFFL